MHVLIPAVQREGGYDDLALCLHSLRMYAPAWRVTVGWQGESNPRMHLDVTYSRVPDEADGFGPAVRHLLLSVLDDDLVLVLNDDTVITPDTAGLLHEDWRAVSREEKPPGLLGLRSNFVAGPQNIRCNNQSKGLRGLRWETESRVLLVTEVFGVAFAAYAKVLRETTDWMHLHWYSDNLLSYDLSRRGYQHYVSRAYVHHHGSRSTSSWAQADETGRAWLREHRPDVYATLR